MRRTMEKRNVAQQWHFAGKVMSTTVPAIIIFFIYYGMIYRPKIECKCILIRQKQNTRLITIINYIIHSALCKE